MNRLLSLGPVFFILATLSVAAQPQWAQSFNKWEFSFFGGVARAGDRTSPTLVQDLELVRPISLNYAAGYLLGARLSENLGEHFAAELDYSYANQPFDFVNLTPSLPLLEFDHHIHTLYYSILFYPVERNHTLRPFFSVGAGASFFQVDKDSKDMASFEGVLLRDRWKFVGGFGGGLKYLINNNWGLRFDIRDQISGVPDYGLPAAASSFQTTISPAFNADGLMHHWNLSGGIIYHWGY